MQIIIRIVENASMKLESRLGRLLQGIISVKNVEHQLEASTITVFPAQR